MSRRTAIHARWPTSTSMTVSGVASMAKYVRTHLIAASTGYIDSFPPICIAVDARSPGARKSR